MHSFSSSRDWFRNSSQSSPSRRRARRGLCGWEALEVRRLLAADIGSDFTPDFLVEKKTEVARDALRPVLLRAELEPLPAFGPQLAPLEGPFINSETFRLHSKPDSNFTIYLDFDGHITEGTTWNQAQNLPSIVSPAYDRGGTPGVFTQLELDLIQNAWIRVSEDFAAFDVDVTTEDPGAEALRKDTTGTDTRWGVRVIMTVDNFAACGCGGFAYLNSFQDSTDEPSFVFNNSLDGVSETISHEVGHQLSLNHDGLTSPVTEYYSGHGSGATSWGPILGASFSRTVTQWDKGEYFNANNTGDDLLAITTQNGFGYRADDFGNTRATAESLTVAGSTLVTGLGIIERNTDVDFFKFDTGTGNVSFTIAPQADRPNLDVWAGIYSAVGTLIAQSNPLGSLTAQLTNVFLTAGTYYLKVDGVGSHGVYNAITDSVEDPTVSQPWKNSSPTGYSQYGSLGQYRVVGTIVAPTANQFAIAPLLADQREGNNGTTNFTFSITRNGDTSVASSVDYRVLRARQPAPGTKAPATVSPADFLGGVLPSGSVAFLNGEASKQITLVVNGDTQIEPDEHFVVELINAPAGWGYADSRAPGVIQGDESRVNVQNGVQFRWRQENFSSASGDNWAIDNVSVTNTSFSDDFDPSIDFSQWSSIVNGTASTAFGGTGNSLRFSGPNSRTATTNAIRAQSGDTLQFSLIFGNTSSGENVILEYTIDSGQNWKLIRNYDQNFYKSWTSFSVPIPSNASSSALALPEGNSGATTFPFTVFRTDNLDKSIDVSWSVAGTGSSPASANDFVGGVWPSGLLTFAAGQSSQTLSILVAGDTDFEADETFELQLTASTGGLLGIDRRAGTILNDDSPFSLDFGDAPDAAYGTLLASNGPRHTATGPFLGKLIDTEADGQPTANANGDGADEDGVRFPNLLIAGTTVSIEVTSSTGGGILDYFFDFDGSGGFGNVANEIFSIGLSGGTQLIPVTIPVGSVSNTFARFRLSTAGGLGPRGLAPTGEVEDYAISIFSSLPPLDFGDAPSSYATLAASDGPRHVMAGPRLGVLVDAEVEGQPSPMSTADGADDDGVVFRSRLLRGTTVDVSISSTGGQLDYFFDFDGNGVFGNQPNEIFSATLVSGIQTVPVVVPAIATLGITQARFRLSRAGGLLPTGLAFDGEVEDYQVRVVDRPAAAFDFDSVAAPTLPAGWTLSGSGTSNPWVTVGNVSHTAPNHAFVADISTVSSSSLVSPIIPLSTQATQLSFYNNYNTEENFDGGVLEIAIDGGTFDDILSAGGTFATGGYVSVLSGDFSNPLSNRLAWHGNSQGYILTTVNLPAVALGKNVQLRWRMGTDDSVASIGWRIDSIVFSSVAEPFDFGDAPTTYATLNANAGAAHALLGNLRLGATVDSEPDGQPNATAAGDGADEDGVAFPTALIAGGTSTITVEASAAGLLNAWVDFAADGSWSQLGDQIVKDVPVVAGTNLIQINVPLNATVGTTFSRWRLSNQSALAFDGTAPDGEIEDYVLSISADTTAPTITGVRVGSVGGVFGYWNSTFVQYVDPTLQLGYQIPTGSQQLDTLPWNNINRIYVTFSEDVGNSISDEDFQLIGTPGKNPNQTPGIIPGFTVNWLSASNTAELVLDRFLQPAYLRLNVLAHGVTDGTNLLDGEWVTGWGRAQSGDAQAGGDFGFVFAALPGDSVLGAPVVNSDDLVRVFALQNQSILGFLRLDYDKRMDLDGNAVINSDDLVSVFQLQNASLRLPLPGQLFDDLPPDVTVGTVRKRVNLFKEFAQAVDQVLAAES